MLPVLHLNGAKIAGPTVLARKPPAEVRPLLEGHGYEVIEVEGDDLPGMHPVRRGARLRRRRRSSEIQDSREGAGFTDRPRWPMIVLRSPKGWTGPDVVDGVQVAGTWRAHQVPLSGVRDNPAHLAHAGDLAAVLPARSCSTRTAARPAGARREPGGDLRMSAPRTPTAAC